MTKTFLPLCSAALFTWLLALLVGGLLFDTFVLYPNIFHDVPASLGQSMEFLKAGSPAKFFRPFGGLILLTGVITIVSAVKQRKLLIFMSVSFFIVVAGEYIFSVHFFWPRNTILFTEGLKVHSAEKLIAVANEFQQFHWLRLLNALVASSVAAIGLGKFIHAKGYAARPTQDAA